MRCKALARANGRSVLPQVLIVHIQFFIIITRLNISWPSVIQSFQAGIAMITGRPDSIPRATNHRARLACTSQKVVMHCTQPCVV